VLFIVGNLDTSFAFYHDVLGMEVVMQPITYNPNAMLMGLFNAPPAAQSR
jgi:catechol 2,3-dioxygenase-like lactoylglutathione lyase family enzyme